MHLALGAGQVPGCRALMVKRQPERGVNEEGEGEEVSLATVSYTCVHVHLYTHYTF